MSKIGMTFYDDFALIQDVMQLIESNKDGQILDYENNADDREFKQLADYYFDSFNILSNYMAADPTPQEEYAPQDEMLQMLMENGGYHGRAAAMEGQIGGPGFNEREYAGYINRLKKRFGKQGKNGRLFGRFK